MNEVRLHTEDFQNWDRLYRTQFFNSLTGFKSLHLVGTADKKGNSNLAIFNSVFHVGANPPLMGMVIRPSTVPRHTLSNIIENDHYTYNHVQLPHLEQAHHTSAKFQKGESEFKTCGFTEMRTPGFNAPYVKEAAIKIGLTFRERLNVKSNHTIIMIGEVVEVILPEDIIMEDGFIDLTRAEVLTGSGLDAYLAPQKVKRMAYARAQNEPSELKIG